MAAAFSEMCSKRSPVEEKGFKEGEGLRGSSETMEKVARMHETPQ